MPCAGMTTAALLPTRNTPPFTPTVKSTDVFSDLPNARESWGAPCGASIIDTGATDVDAGAEIDLSIQPASSPIVTSVLTVFQLVRRICLSRSARQCAGSSDKMELLLVTLQLRCSAGASRPPQLPAVLRRCNFLAAREYVGLCQFGQ